ncbi:Gfo/Idh/MocA family protein [Aspergillus chevalieri]|uniref:Uncharacterized protein n=1 Tax=Aspergillus chevalieri TaxID=182096 RepID=A0A7R7VTK5_ASPCH|nr:uncharacterized protein ACHE_60361S [Aspergillus chevalieri]BCR90475.1 hypothetical protein ACHE_60361S [Aspergillus chevalieri]
MQHDFKIGMAIVGSGNFAREEHLSSIIDSSDWGCILKAVYSRSLQSAEKLAEDIPATVEKIKRGFPVPDVDIYSDDSGPGKGYTDLLARDDIMAVTIALPITIQPEYIRLAIQAGKHVFSEKPIAKDVATAIELIRWYRSQTGPDRKILWAVGENWRWMDKYKETSTVIANQGCPKSFRVKVHSMIKPNSKYHKTEWRRNSEYQGGFLLDGGVHVVAALRLMLKDSAYNNPLATVSAQCSLQQPHLAPINTIEATIEAKNGTQGTLSLSYGSESNDQIYDFIYSSGSITLDGDTLTDRGEIAFTGRGVTSEMRAFACSILDRSGVVHQRMSPEEALADLEVMEKMIQSSEHGGEKMALKYQVWH